MMTKRILILTAFVLGIILTSCSSDDGPPTANLQLETIGLQPLTGGTTYQGWLIVDGQPRPTEKFTNPSGTINLNVLMSDLEDATQFVLTIEPVGDNDNEPSEAKILTGVFSGTAAPLNFQSVVGDLSVTSGQFFLGTPTDDVADNDEFGVWFMNGTNAPGLVLPDLKSGWKYEGWVDFGTKILSTGTFSNEEVTDDQNFFKGSGGTVPGFPGEDFLIIPGQIPLTGITFPASVVSKRVFITVEPFQDNDPAPFFIAPLSATAGITTGSENPVVMISNTAIPSGRVTRPNL